MKCSVTGCNIESKGEPSGSDKYNLCPTHWGAWGYFLKGYLIALEKDDGRLRRRLWGRAMQEFLEWCRIEISACTEIAESLLRSGKL